MTGAEPKVTKELALSHGLTAEEYDRIIRRLGREPRFTELGLFSALWSEHCAYKHSRVFLRGLPTQAPHVLQGPGENAGIVDLGDGLALTFKIESHNHPSFIEPFQGAATGVGGILRDIFTMLKATGTDPNHFCHACFTGQYQVGFESEELAQLKLFDS